MEQPQGDAARILGRIEERTEGISDDVREIKIMLQVQNGRLRDLERRSDKQDGAWKVGGIMGAVLGTLGGIATKFYG